MADVVQFVGREEIGAQENLQSFICLARDELTAFSSGGAWGELTWSNGNIKVVFCKHRPRSDSKKTPVPLDEPFLDFAKAYVRYSYSHKPVTSLATRLSALRMIEKALIQRTGLADISGLNASVLDLAIRLCGESFEGEGHKYQAGRQIEAIAAFCRECGLVYALPVWKSPLKKPADHGELITEEGEAHRAEKLPTNQSMLALADLFAKAEDKESRYFTSIMVLMMVAPSRISEVFRLSVDCIAWEADSQGEDQIYLRWYASKGGGPMRKWVPAAMQSVVEEAVRRLTEIGGPARAAAKHAFDHPGKFMRHPGCITSSNCGENEELTLAEVGAAIGTKLGKTGGWGQLPRYCSDARKEGVLTYRRLAEEVTSLYKTDFWPFVDGKKEVKAWDALCLVREFELHKAFSPRPFSWRMPSSNEVNDRLGHRQQFSLFHRGGFSEKDGGEIRLTTHQLRHWLSTMSMRAGMDDYTLARWAGRARVEDNRAYDHRSNQERSDELRAILQKDQPSTLEKFKAREPVTYRELGVNRDGAAKATLYGMCVHDYAMAPCMKQRECMTCKEHVCLKGDHVTLDRIKQLEGMMGQLLEKAREGASDGDFGADRWVDHHTWKLAHVRTMRTLLESESVPDGSVLRIPDEYDPSPVRRALMDLGVLAAPATADISIPWIVKAIEGPMEADSDA